MRRGVIEHELNSNMIKKEDELSSD